MGVKEKYQPLYQKLILTMVEHRRFELLTSTMRMSRATNCANAPHRWYLIIIAKAKKKSNRQMQIFLIFLYPRQT